MGKRISKPAPRSASTAAAGELLRHVADAGADPEAVLRRAGLLHSAATLFDPDRQVALARDDFSRLYAECTWALDARAAWQEGRAPLTKPEFDLFCYCMISAETLREAIGRAIAFSAMLMPRTAHLTLHERDGVAELRMATIRKRRNVCAFMSDLTGLSSHHRLFGWLIGEAMPLLDVSMRYPALLSEETAARLMPHPITYRAPENALRFPARLLDQPVVRTNAELRILLERFPFDLEEPQSKLATLTERVRLVIGTALAKGARIPSGTELAAQLSISRATLTRHLCAEGATLGGLKEAIRCELACRLLLARDLSISEISARVGFSDATIFGRAFKGWTGASPQNWAAGHREGRRA